jgi:hypothetical protein
MQVTIAGYDKEMDENIVAIKRNDDNGSIGSLDNLFGYNATNVEHENKIEVVPCENMEKVLKVFDKFIEKKYVNVDKHLSSNVLTPDEISTFMKIMPIYSHHENYLSVSVRFVEYLTKYSYDHGHNNFYFNFDNNIYLDYFLKIKAEKDRPLKIFIDGDVGEYFGELSKNIEVLITGTVGDNFGHRAKNLTAVVEKEVGSDYFCYSDSNNYFVNGYEITIWMNGEFSKIGNKGDVKTNSIYKKVIKNWGREI